MAEKKVTARAGEEVWEMCTGGRVWVAVTDAKGIEKSKSVSQRGSRLRIMTTDRELAQERIRDPKNDPFTNGTLIRLDADQNTVEETASSSALTDKDLLGFLAKKQGAVFKKAVGELSEVSYRRLKALMRDNDDVTAAQTKAMDELYEENYNPNKDWQDPGGDSSEAIAASFPEVNLTTGKERENAPRS